MPQAGEPGEGEQEELAEGGSGARAAIWSGGVSSAHSLFLLPKNLSVKRCFLTIPAGKAAVKFLG